MIEAIGVVISGAFGLAIVVAILAFIYKRHAEEWQRLALVYGSARANPQRVKRFGQLVLYCDGAPARPYKGLFRLEIYSDGLGLRPYRFLIPFHDPLFIPYEDIRGWSQTWYLDGESVELQAIKAPEMRIIMPRSQLDWIRNTSGQMIDVSPNKPPHGQWPWMTHTAALVSGVMGVSLIVLMVLKHYGLVFA